MKVKRPATKANKIGGQVESILAGVLRAGGLVFDRQVQIGISVFESVIRVDFVISNLAQYPDGLAVESKWQDGPGSVDEKFLYLVKNIQERYPLPTVVVVAGGGCRPGALKWLRSQVDGTRLVSVLTLEEFVSWALRADKQ